MSFVRDIVVAVYSECIPVGNLCYGNSLRNDVCVFKILSMLTFLGHLTAE